MTDFLTGILNGMSSGAETPCHVGLANVIYDGGMAL